MGTRTDILTEIDSEKFKSAIAERATYDIIRHKYVQALSELTGRNVIVYFSGWQSKLGNLDFRDISICDEDRDAFMSVVYGLDCDKGLDLVIHTLGGEIAATQNIILYLQEKFGNNIRAIIPHTAMSGGTVMAISCKEILMTRHACLGPTDPQVGGVSAQAVMEEVNRANKEMKAGSGFSAIWPAIIGKYMPTFIGECKKAIAWNAKFSKEVLEKNMLSDATQRSKKINRIIQALTSGKLHVQPIRWDEAQKIGLTVKLIEDDQDLQDTVLSVHHSFSHTINQTPACKIIQSNSDNPSGFIKCSPR